MDAKFFIEKLQLTQKVENGHLKAFYPNCVKISKAYTQTKEDRSLFSTAFYLLERPYLNPLHKINGYEIWQYQNGADLNLYTLSPGGEKKCVVLGKNKELFHIVPSGFWQCAEINEENYENFSLIFHFNAPSFHIDDHVKGKYEELVRLFPSHVDFIKKFQWKD